MKVFLNVDYRTEWGQTVYIYGSTKELGEWDESKALSLTYASPSRWFVELDVDAVEPIEYKYFVKKDNCIIRKEEGSPHCLKGIAGYSMNVYDEWQEKEVQRHLYTSAFTESFYSHSKANNMRFDESSLLLQVKCPIVDSESVLKISGSSKELGNWQIEKAHDLHYIGNGIWKIAFDINSISMGAEYKYLIYNKKKNVVVEWESGCNRFLPQYNISDKSLYLINETYRLNALEHWLGAGVAIPVFSLRSTKSCGIGDFLDLKKMVDWAAKTKQRVVQILPINDTTSTFTNADSYPYSAISVYALHPIYLGLSCYTLSDKKLESKFKDEFEKLNSLPILDYETVLKKKIEYLRLLYNEIGKNVLRQKEFKQFYSANELWLFPYASFCYLRDKYKTCEINNWGEYKTYNEYRLHKLASKPEVREDLNFTYFCQYLLHEQLLGVKEYAHSRSIVLKGDIPIGVDPNSVDVWVEPHLFNLDTQTGAPPDDFAIDGQNWGFPTYNWTEMSKDGYQWWIKRFSKMADYFDAYRIDHILGFFRIWEIPSHSVHGLLGYFNPALPYSLDEIAEFDFEFKEDFIYPYIDGCILDELFGEYKGEVKNQFLTESNKQLKDEFNTQKKIQKYFEGKEDDKSLKLRDGLFQLCNEVLFIRDKYKPDRYHPRISAYRSSVYKSLDENQKYTFDKLYNHFFYHRHNDFWQENAMKKLPVLISSTRMLACGEDLGMIPESVPIVMKELQILSLEIERMPKRIALFSDLSKLSYLSVCSTSTHDMSPIREWWQEDKALTQEYYNEVLKYEGEVPIVCSDVLCKQILDNHLHSPSMLVILPLQDWLSISDTLRRKDPSEERINIPSESNHYWGYRMHMNLEKLIESNEFNEDVRMLIENSKRTRQSVGI